MMLDYEVTKAPLGWIAETFDTRSGLTLHRTWCPSYKLAIILGRVFSA